MAAQLGSWQASVVRPVEAAIVQLVADLNAKPIALDPPLKLSISELFLHLYPIS